MAVNTGSRSRALRSLTLSHSISCILPFSLFFFSSSFSLSHSHNFIFPSCFIPTQLTTSLPQFPSCCLLFVTFVILLSCSSRRAISQFLVPEEVVLPFADLQVVDTCKYEAITLEFWSFFVIMPSNFNLRARNVPHKFEYILIT